MVSMRDVAQRAGVSLSTVSIILNGNAETRKIPEKTQQKVLKAMEDLHYVPNHYAKGLRQRENARFMIALFWSFDFRRVMMTRFISGLLDGIRENAMNATLSIYPYLQGKLADQKDLFHGSAFHAAIVANADDNDLKFLIEEKMETKIILYNREQENFSSVKVDNAEIGRIGAAHLLMQGYRRPVVITGIQDYIHADARKNAFQVTFLNGKQSAEQIDSMATENSVEGGAICAKKILEAVHNGTVRMPDSFFCASDAIAIGLTNTLAETGLRIPEDVGVVAVGNGEPQYSQYNNPGITVIHIPMEEMGRGAVEVLQSQMSQPVSRTEARKLCFKAKLIARKSTQKS